MSSDHRLPDRNAGFAAPDAIDHFRRQVVLGAGAALAALVPAPFAIAQSGLKIRIAFWPTPAGLPFYAALEKGFFKEAGLDVQARRLVTTAQLMETMRSVRVDGSASGTPSIDLADREIKTPGLYKIIVADSSDAEHVVDEFLVAKDAELKSISELKGKNVGSWPDRQNLALCSAILAKNGAADAIVTALPITQHVAAIDNRRVEAVYTLEPTGTAGRLNGTTRVLEGGVVAKYVLGDAKAAWFSGGASLTGEFIRKYPVEAKKYIDAYRRGVEYVRKEPAEARQYLKGYTALDGALMAEVPLVGYTMHDEFEASSIAMFQKYLDFLTDKMLLGKQASAASMIHKA